MLGSSPRSRIPASCPTFRYQNNIAYNRSHTVGAKTPGCMHQNLKAQFSPLAVQCAAPRTFRATLFTKHLFGGESRSRTKEMLTATSLFFCCDDIHLLVQDLYSVARRLLYLKKKTEVVLNSGKSLLFVVYAFECCGIHKSCIIKVWGIGWVKGVT